MNNVDISRYSKKIASLIWDTEPKNDGQATIWCLGHKYDAIAPPSSEEAAPMSASTLSRPSLEAKPSDNSFVLVNHETKFAASHQGDALEWPQQFLDDFESKIWFTYRTNFPPIPKSEDPRAASTMSLAVRMKNIGNQVGFTSDTGWGCMIRSGQSILANALVLSSLGREWVKSQERPDEARIISLFADDPQAPFSIHKFVEHGAAACGTYPGQWFGPSATAKCIEALSNRHPDAGLRVYATDNSPDVYTSRLMAAAKPDADEQFHPTLLLVGTRLGIDHVTPVYRSALLATLQMPQAVGIAGGRPSSSHYFVGSQGQNIFYLDPHTSRPAMPYHSDPLQYTREQVDSYHTRRLRCLSIEDMDPSMLIAFLLRTEQDWLDWRTQVESWPGKRIFHIIDAEPPATSQEREAALDEVSTFDTEDETGLDDDGTEDT